MVIFHSYVSLPEGSSDVIQSPIAELLLSCRVCRMMMDDAHTAKSHPNLCTKSFHKNHEILFAMLIMIIMMACPNFRMHFLPDFCPGRNKEDGLPSLRRGTGPSPSYQTDWMIWCGDHSQEVTHRTAFHCLISFLVGGLEHDSLCFHILGIVIIRTDEIIFFRGVETTNQV